MGQSPTWPSRHASDLTDNLQLRRQASNTRSLSGSCNARCFEESEVIRNFSERPAIVGAFPIRGLHGLMDQAQTRRARQVISLSKNGTLSVRSPTDRL